MSLKLPTKRAEWVQAAKNNSIQLDERLAAGEDFSSASKFTFDHFLRLRILYIEREPPMHLAASDGFPTKGLEVVEHILDKNPDACSLKRFLRNKDNIRDDWNRKRMDESGKFSLPLDHLHLIAKRKPVYMGNNQDLDNNRIVWSPRQTRGVSKSSALALRGSPSTPSHPPRLPQGRGNYDTSPSSSDDSLEFSHLTIESPEEVISPPNTDLRRAQDDLHRSDFSQGDEQTVNAALVDFMKVLSFLLGFTGRILHDRAKYIIPKDSKTHLYSASVDGLIRHFHDDTINAFMEVKGALRTGNQPVRRQIGAQMAAFVYEQDVQIKVADSVVDTEVRPPSKGQGKQAKNKGSKAKGEKVEDQKKKKKK